MLTGDVLALERAKEWRASLDLTFAEGDREDALARYQIAQADLAVQAADGTNRSWRAVDCLQEVLEDYYANVADDGGHPVREMNRVMRWVFSLKGEDETDRPPSVETDVMEMRVELDELDGEVADLKASLDSLEGIVRNLERSLDQVDDRLHDVEHD